MTPLLQIATVIIIAVLIPLYWRKLLGLGALLGAIGVVLSFIGFGLWIGADALVLENEHIGLWAAVLGFYSAVFAGLATLHWHLDRRAKRKEAAPDPVSTG